MESVPLRSSEDHVSSGRSSMTDIPVISPPRLSTAPLRADEPTFRNSTSFDSDHPGSIEDLDIEDPLSRVYVRDDEFEPFSRTEIAFVSVSCIGVMALPLLFLLVSKLGVSIS